MGESNRTTPAMLAAPHLRPLDLKRHLFVRVCLFALIVHASGLGLRGPPSSGTAPTRPLVRNTGNQVPELLRGSL